MNSVDTKDIITTVRKIINVKGKVARLWYDTCSIVIVFYDRSLHKTYQERSMMGSKYESGIELIQKSFANEA